MPDKNLYKVTLFYSRMPIPLQFATHPWFVCEGDGIVDRWEVWQAANQCETSWGHVHKDLFSPFRGMSKNPVWLRKNNKALWPAIQLYHLKGDENSIVRNIVHFIREESPHYAFRDQYRYFPGPNSNTYAQWIVDSFHEFDVRLPWSFIGKRYKRGSLIK